MRILTALLSIFWVVSPSFAQNQFDAMLVRQAEIDKFVYDAPMFIKEKTLAALRELAPLKNELKVKAPNPHVAGLSIEYSTLIFEGLEIYGAIQNNDVLNIIKITITKPRWKILNSLDVGSDSERVENILGKPTEVYDIVKRYCGETECVNFYVENSKIIKIELHYYFD